MQTLFVKRVHSIAGANPMVFQGGYMATVHTMLGGWLTMALFIVIILYFTPHGSAPA